jgi:hypothetical protein
MLKECAKLLFRQTAGEKRKAREQKCIRRRAQGPKGEEREVWGRPSWWGNRLPLAATFIRHDFGASEMQRQRTGAIYYYQLMHRH